jgi:branched-subunit amino acid transport protein
VTWVVVVAVGVGSFVLRAGPQLLLERVSLAPRTERVLRHAGIAAIVALIVGSARQSALRGGAAPVVAALVVGMVVAVRRPSMLGVLMVGGGAYACAILVEHLVAG